MTKGKKGRRNSVRRKREAGRSEIGRSMFSACRAVVELIKERRRRGRTNRCGANENPQKQAWASRAAGVFAYRLRRGSTDWGKKVGVNRICFRWKNWGGGQAGWDTFFGAHGTQERAVKKRNVGGGRFDPKVCW